MLHNNRGYLYLAAPWTERGLMDERAAQLEKNGWKITHRWWNYDGNGQDGEKADFLESCAKCDMYGVLQAHAVILFNTAKSEGKAIEQGIALAARIPIIAIGKRGEFSANVFHYLDCYTWVDNIDAALVTLLTGV